MLQTATKTVAPALATFTSPTSGTPVSSLPAITAAFESAYRALYHRLPQGVPVEALNWRVTVAGPPPGVRFAVAPAATGVQAAVKGVRQAWFAEADGFVETTVYDRYALAPETTLSGPAIVEERESTVVLGPGAHITVDPARALIVQMPEANQ
jgi:N-methylhydantoinase A